MGDRRGRLRYVPGPCPINSADFIKRTGTSTATCSQSPGLRIILDYALYLVVLGFVRIAAQQTGRKTATGAAR